ncbi:hypothetical protein D3C78_1735350 [compost metagenome]
MAWRFVTGITLQHFTEQARVAPAIHQNVMVGVDHMPAVLAVAYQHQAQQGGRRQVEAGVQFVLRNTVQELFKSSFRASIEQS